MTAALDNRTRAAAPAASAPPDAADAAAAADVAPPEGVARAHATTNVRLRPAAGAEVVAILPGGRSARVLGRSAAGDWLRVAYPAGSDIRGWLPTDRVEVTAETLDSLIVVGGGSSSATPEAAVAAAPFGAARPDLVITDAYLLRDGRLVIEMRNLGPGELRPSSVGLTITSEAGELIGVLTAGPAALAPGGVATVVTPVVITETGGYRLEIDRADEIAEARELNNAYSVLLIAPRG